MTEEEEGSGGGGRPCLQVAQSPTRWEDRGPCMSSDFRMPPRLWSPLRHCHGLPKAAPVRGRLPRSSRTVHTSHLLHTAPRRARGRLCPGGGLLSVAASGPPHSPATPYQCQPALASPSPAPAMKRDPPPTPLPPRLRKAKWVHTAKVRVQHGGQGLPRKKPLCSDRHPCRRPQQSWGSKHPVRTLSWLCPRLPDSIYPHTLPPPVPSPSPRERAAWAAAQVPRPAPSAHLVCCLPSLLLSGLQAQSTHVRERVHVCTHIRVNTNL